MPYHQPFRNRPLRRSGHCARGHLRRPQPDHPLPSLTTCLGMYLRYAQQKHATSGGTSSALLTTRSRQPETYGVRSTHLGIQKRHLPPVMANEDDSGKGNHPAGEILRCNITRRKVTYSISALRLRRSSSKPPLYVMPRSLLQIRHLNTENPSHRPRQ